MHSPAPKPIASRSSHAQMPPTIRSIRSNISVLSFLFSIFAKILQITRFACANSHT